MCDRRIDPVTWSQYNPYLQTKWSKQYNNYASEPQTVPPPPVPFPDNCHLLRRWERHHPELQRQWNNQMSAYRSQGASREVREVRDVSDVSDVREVSALHGDQTGGKWEDPFKDIRFWKIVDFFREFELTK